VLLSSQLLGLPDPLSLKLEQRLLAGQADVEAALWRRAAQACALTARHQHYSDLVLRDELQPTAVPFIQVFLLRVEDRRCGILRERLELRLF